MARASGYYKTGYAQQIALLETRAQRAWFAALALLLVALPLMAGGFVIDLANQVFLAVIGSVALMLLTGVAGQVSLGHAGLLAAGALTVGVLTRETGAPFWITLPAAAVAGALLGIVFGLPSLRLKGLYLGISTLALHFVVTFLGHEYEAWRGFSSGVTIDPPRVFGIEIYRPGAWYAVLLLAAVLVVIFALNLLRTRTGRAWRAIHDRDVVAEALGVPVYRAKLSAFVVSSTLTAFAGGLFAYYRGFVATEAFSMFLTIQYVAMVIIGGLGSILGAILGAVFVTLLPYVIEAVVRLVGLEGALTGYVFAINYACFGIAMIFFLAVEPEGLAGIWRRVRDYFLLWPFRTTPLARGR
jgi:branched-chain amino acid transport system permease protein